MLGVEREVCVDGWMRGRWFLAGVIGYGWRLSIGGVGVYGYTTLQLGFIQLWYGWGATTGKWTFTNWYTTQVTTLLSRVTSQNGPACWSVVGISDEFLQKGGRSAIKVKYNYGHSRWNRQPKDV
jgi:hypothetical protein